MERHRTERIEWQGSRGGEEGREGLRNKEASHIDNEFLLFWIVDISMSVATKTIRKICNR